MPPDPLLPTDHRGLPPPSVAGHRSRSAPPWARPQVIVGSVLCGAAALGLWWTFEQTAAEPTTSYVVARTRLAPGKVIEATDVAMVPMHLPAEVAASVFSEGDSVVGNVVVQAIHAGEIVTQGDIGSRQAVTDRVAGYAISIELNRPAALNGLISAGERVDVVVTNADLADGHLLGAADALILDVDDRFGSERLSGAITVTLQVQDRATAMSLASAAEFNAVTLIRPWGMPPPTLP